MCANLIKKRENDKQHTLVYLFISFHFIAKISKRVNKRVQNYIKKVQVIITPTRKY